jgi:hypothetical protein
MKFVTLALSLVLTVSVFAGNPSATQSVKEVSWDDLKGACSNPHSQGNQNQPAAITISCKHSKKRWEQSSSPSKLLNTRFVRGSLKSNKYTVSEQRTETDTLQDVTCSKYNQVLDVYSRDLKEIGCGEIADFDSITEFCQERLDFDIDGQSDIVSTSATGQQKSYCPEAQATGGKGFQRD